LSSDVSYDDCFVGLKLPMGRKGRWLVGYEDLPAGYVFHVSGLRDRIMAGARPLKVTSDKKEKIYYLTELNRYGEQKRLWMSTQPAEVYSHTQILKRFHGRVLVGGLGLGVAVSILEKDPWVTDIVVIEKSRQVKDLVWPHLKTKKSRIVVADLFSWLKRHSDAQDERFDQMFLDTWIGTGEYVLWHQVVPLRRMAQRICNPMDVHCWKADTMEGQVRISIEISMSGRNCTDALIDRQTPNLYRCPDEQLLGYRESLGLKYAWYNWVRTNTDLDSVTTEELLTKMHRFMEALRFPTAWDRDWQPWYGVSPDWQPKKKLSETTL
jgi:hypothetical protein